MIIARNADAGKSRIMQSNDKPIVPTDVNGKTVDVLLYKGTTYLPVRAVANALDQAVAWDGASYSVYIGSHKDV